MYKYKERELYKEDKDSRLWKRKKSGKRDEKFNGIPDPIRNPISDLVWIK